MNLSSPESTSIREKQQRLRELQIEQAQLESQLQVQKYAHQYEIELAFPATVVGNNLRTNDEIIQHRLLEAGMLYEVPVKIGDVIKTTNQFVHDLQRTGLYNSVRVEVGSTKSKDGGDSKSSSNDSGDSGDANGTANLRNLKVILDEANWYRFHAGGGLKTDGLLNPELSSSSSSSSTGGFLLPTAELEASIGLRNLTGLLDHTKFQYTLDTKSITSLTFEHERPLYTILPGILGDTILSLPTNGSQFGFKAKATIDTMDYEYTRSYKEYQRSISVQAANTHSYVRSDQCPKLYYGLEWSTTLRDVVPRRHATMPYSFEASPEIVSQAGPNVKHSIKAEIRTNGQYITNHPHLMPTNGYESHATAELATPPGDVGFYKLCGGSSIHQTLLKKNGKIVALHGIFNTGYLHGLSFNGLCRPVPPISDRFFIGGPIQLRGFAPAGIGPRATSSYSSSSNATNIGGQYSSPSNALGGVFYYTATAMASVSPRGFYNNTQQPQPRYGEEAYAGVEDATTTTTPPFRFFGFVTAGTCVGGGGGGCSLASQQALSSIVQSSRVSLGVGLTTCLFGPRLELTWSWPIRYGPRDIRKQFQFGMGFQFE